MYVTARRSVFLCVRRSILARSRKRNNSEDTPYTQQQQQQDSKQWPKKMEKSQKQQSPSSELSHAQQLQPPSSKPKLPIESMAQLTSSPPKLKGRGGTTTNNNNLKKGANIASGGGKDDDDMQGSELMKSQSKEFLKLEQQLTEVLPKHQENEQKKSEKEVGEKTKSDTLKNREKKPKIQKVKNIIGGDLAASGIQLFLDVLFSKS